ncbi:MAG: heavy-metal-associated domain-containing protein, partial [Chlorobi bacterium]|nr:heavy-metal-associated domain-containing protein [Chlorobiota bacterium]
VTVFAIAMMAFPKYSGIFYPRAKAGTEITSLNRIKTVDLNISGMTCSGCEEHIEYAASTVPGFVKADADFTTGKATVTFDAGKATSEDIIKAIDKTGYKVVSVEEEK